MMQRSYPFRVPAIFIIIIASANTCRSRLPSHPMRGALTRLMPNICGPREAERRLVESVYAAPIWTSALNNHAILKKLFLAQRGVVMRIVSAYRIVSTSAVLVLAGVPSIDLLGEERKETFQLCKELICLFNLQEIATRRRPSARMEGADSSRNGRRDGMVTNPGDGRTV